MTFFHVVLVGIVCTGLGFGGWFATPKGINQVLIRTMILMSITCCYMMWSITYLAQLNPLESPKRNDLRPPHKA